MSGLNQNLIEAIVASKFVIFDNDGVMYECTASILDEFHRATAAAVLPYAPHLSIETLKAIGHESYGKYSSALDLFCERYSIPSDILHFAYHENCDHSIISPVPLLSDMFETFYLPRAILTHGSRDWVKRVLGQLNIDQYFADDSIYAFEHVDYQRKSHSSYPFQYVLDREGYAAKDSFMIEDSPANLIHAKKIGMKTILVTKGMEIPSDTYPHVDFTIGNLMEFMIAAKDVHPRVSPIAHAAVSSGPGF